MTEHESRDCLVNGFEVARGDVLIGVRALCYWVKRVNPVTLLTPLHFVLLSCILPLIDFFLY